MIKMIAAVSINGVIGTNNTIPWQGRYADDMKFFRTMTKDSVVVMGRNTFESMNSKPLPKRENRIVGGFQYKSVADALSTLATAPSPTSPGPNVWLIGGEGIYAEGLQYADEVYLTLIPEVVDTARKSVARFPFVHPLEWDCEKRLMGELVPAANEQKLVVAVYKRSKTQWRA